MNQDPDEDPKRHFYCVSFNLQTPTFCFFFAFYLFKKSTGSFVLLVSHNVDFADCVLREVFNVCVYFFTFIFYKLVVKSGGLIRCYFT